MRYKSANWAKRITLKTGMGSSKASGLAYAYTLTPPGFTWLVVTVAAIVFFPKVDISIGESRITLT
jgi:hypothetical protein